jgi:hypothetical protein
LALLVTEAKAAVLAASHIDLNPRSSSALSTATWGHGTSGRPPTNSFSAVHEKSSRSIAAVASP